MFNEPEARYVFLISEVKFYRNCFDELKFKENIQKIIQQNPNINSVLRRRERTILVHSKGLINLLG